MLRHLGSVKRSVEDGREKGTEGFSFVGMGESGQGELAPVSERHDKALEEAFGRFFWRPSFAVYEDEGDVCR